MSARVEAIRHNKGMGCMQKLLDNQEGTRLGGQYGSLYFCRLALLGPRTRRMANRRWGSPTDQSKWVTTLEASVAVDSDEMRIVGVIARHCGATDIEMRALHRVTHLADEALRKRARREDHLKIEDGSGRLAISMERPFDADDESSARRLALELPSGSVVALRGHCRRLTSEEQGAPFHHKDVGMFVIREWTLPFVPLSSPLKPSEPLGAPLRVAILSGLGLREADDTNDTNALLEALRNQDVTHVIVAGNGCARWDVDNPSRDYTDTIVEHMQALDEFLGALCTHASVDYMCGADDPSPRFFPQRPMHSALLPRAAAEPRLRLCSNPHECSIGPWRFAGSSGQPIDDLSRISYGDADDAPGALHLLRRTLECGHFAPTAPETLPCQPYLDNDPLVLRHRPDVYFAGNQPEAASSVYSYTQERAKTHTLLLTVPRYDRTRQLYIVELNSKEDDDSSWVAKMITV